MQRFHQRLAAFLPGQVSLLGGAAADLRLNGVKLPDPAQRLFRQR
jgi:hypothetical protein